MATISTNIAMVRQRLLYPEPNTPADPDLLNIMLEKVSDHCLQLNNTQNHWSVATIPLSVAPGVEDYPVPVDSGFGRPFLVYTIDPSDPYHRRREIPFTLMQNADQNYRGPQQSQVQEHSAVEMSFYRTPASNPQWYVRLTPIPGAVADYQLLFESIYDPQAASLGDQPGLTPFHHLIRVETALDALPGCAWGKLSVREDREGWKLQCATLADVFTAAIAKYQKQFDAYKAQMVREGVTQKKGVGRDYLDDLTGGAYGGFSNIRW